MPSPASDLTIELSNCGSAQPHAENGCETGCDSEQVLPTQPRQWCALPPTRHCHQLEASTSEALRASTLVDVGGHLPCVDPGNPIQSEAHSGGASEASKFFACLKDVFEELEDLNERFGSVLKRRAQVFADYDLKMKVPDWNQLCVFPSIKNKSRPSISSEIEVNESADNSMSVNQTPSINATKSTKSVISAVTVADDFWESYRRTDSVSTDANVIQSFSGTSRPSMKGTRSFGKRSGAASRVGFDESMTIKQGRNSVDFHLREEWKLDEDQVIRLANKATVEFSMVHRTSDASAFSARPFSVKNRWQTVPWHPENTSRFYWDLFAAALLAYDTVMLPLYLFEIRHSSVTRIVEWITAIFWTLDIVASFCTGVFVKGQLEMKFSHVSRKYAKTWLTLDILMVLTEWVLIAFTTGDDPAASSVGAVRNMRALRFMRLVRLVKFERLSNQLMRRVNSVYLILSFRIIKMILAIVVSNHILASFWYAIGTNGWVKLAFPDKRDVLYCYLTSFYWTLTQFHGSDNIAPTTLEERIFAVLLLLTAFVAVTWFVSSVTNSMITLQNIHQERSAQQRCLLSFLSQHNVSKLLTIRIKEYVAMYQKENVELMRESDVVMLHVLPENILMDLHVEVRGGSLLEHPLFFHMEFAFAACYQQLAHEAVQEVIVSIDDVIFSTGQACHRMLFSNTELSYRPGNLRKATSAALEGSKHYQSGTSFGISSWSQCSGASSVISLGGEYRLSGKGWVSEPVLWTMWINCGTLTALETSCLHALEVNSFIKATRLYETVRLDIVEYAKTFVDYLNDALLSDLPSGVDAYDVWADLNNESAARRQSSLSSRNPMHSLRKSTSSHSQRTSVRGFFNKILSEKK